MTQLHYLIAFLTCSVFFNFSQKEKLPEEKEPIEETGHIYYDFDCFEDDCAEPELI